MTPQQEEFLDQCSAFIIGGLDEKEAKQFAEFLESTDADRRRDFSKLVWTAAHLSSMNTQIEPPNSVKQSLMNRIRNEKDRTENNEVAAKPHEPLTFVLANEGKWFPHPLTAEIKVKLLSIERKRGYATILIEVPPGVRYPEHHHHGAEECYVLEGDLHVAGRVLGPGDFHHADADSDHGELYTINGGRALLVVAIEDIFMNG
ncbi:MAG: cupin domain-containing protein [Ignavibacteriae bacterium]|nr:cupin domain-containing protein [Ignavibacteriota bacterium]